MKVKDKNKDMKPLPTLQMHTKFRNTQTLHTNEVQTQHKQWVCHAICEPNVAYAKKKKKTIIIRMK